MNPLMNASIALRRARRIRPVSRRESEAVGPAGIVRHEPAAGGPADDGTQRGQSRQLGVLLRVTERRRALRPAVKAEGRPAEPRCKLQKRFVKRHVKGGRAGAGLKQIPVFNHENKTYPRDSEIGRAFV